MGSMEKKRLLYAVIICLPILAGVAKVLAKDPAVSLKGSTTSFGEKDMVSAEKVLQNLKKPALKEAEKLLPKIKKNIHRQTQNATDFLTNKKTTAPKKPSSQKKPEAFLFYFFSFSMPAPSLDAAAQEASAAGAIMILRGLSENSFSETAKRIRRLSEKSSVEVWIDPILFECFEVSSVPQIVLVRNFSRERGCLDNNYTTKVRGDVSLSFALSLMEKEDENAALFSERIKNNGFYSH